MIVIDASLATKWFIVEPDSEAAIDFLASHVGGLHAPDLLLVEVASALVRTANMQKDKAAEMVDGLARWTGTIAKQGIELHRVTGSLVAAASQIAIRIGHPLKDCVYLALSERLDAELATCDARFRDRAIASYPRIRLLADYA